MCVTEVGVGCTSISSDCQTAHLSPFSNPCYIMLNHSRNFHPYLILPLLFTTPAEAKSDGIDKDSIDDYPASPLHSRPHRA